MSSLIKNRFDIYVDGEFAYTVTRDPFPEHDENSVLKDFDNKLFINRKIEVKAHDTNYYIES